MGGVVRGGRGHLAKEAGPAGLGGRGGGGRAGGGGLRGRGHGGRGPVLGGRSLRGGRGARGGAHARGAAAGLSSRHLVRSEWVFICCGGRECGSFRGRVLRELGGVEKARLFGCGGSGERRRSASGTPWKILGRCDWLGEGAVGGSRFLIRSGFNSSALLALGPTHRYPDA